MSNTESDISHIKEAIVRSFPDEIFSDMNFPGDGDEFDEDRDLYYMLKGRKWSEVPVDFIRANPSQIVFGAAPDNAIMCY